MTDQTNQTDVTEKSNELNEAEMNVVEISSEPSVGAKWYVVHTYSGHEGKIAINLKQRAESLGFLDKIFKVLIPTQQKIVVNEGKKRKVEEKIFPGYILVLMKMTDEAWHLVRSTKGVTGFVGVGTKPTPLPESEVRTLVKFMRMEAPKFEAKFIVGDSVKITDGPFKEFLGKVEEVNEEQGKVKVLVSMLGRETPVELDFIQVSSL